MAKIRSFEITDAEHEEFVRTHPNGHLMQLTGWAQEKSITGWTSARIAVGKGTDVTGVAQLLFKKVPGVPVKLAYCPRGVVVDWSEKASVDTLLRATAKLALSKGAVLLRLDPGVRITDPNVAHALRAHGFTRTDPGEDARMLSQPAVRMVTDLSGDLDEYYADLSKGTTWSIRKAQKAGLEVTIGGEENLAAFHDLMRITGERDNFSIRSLEYFQAMWDSFGPNGDMDVTVIRLDTRAALEDAQAVLADAQRLLGNKQKAKTKTEKVLRQIDELQARVDQSQARVDELTAFAARSEGENLAASVLVRCGKKASYLYAASSNQFRELRPSYLMVWSLMQHVKDRGSSSFDFGGVDAAEGLETFKAQWHPERVEYVGEFDKPLLPGLGQGLGLALKIFKKRSLGPKER